MSEVEKIRQKAFQPIDYTDDERSVILVKDVLPLARRLDKIPSILSAVKYENFMMASKWNSLKEIAEIQELFVRKDGKICVDIVDIQGIIGEALDDFIDLVKKVLERLSKEE